MKQSDGNKPKIGDIVWNIATLTNEGRLVPIRIYEIIEKDGKTFLRFTPYTTSPLNNFIPLNEVVTTKKAARKIAYITLQQKRRAINKEIEKLFAA